MRILAFFGLVLVSNLKLFRPRVNSLLFYFFPNSYAAGRAVAWKLAIVDWDNCTVISIYWYCSHLLNELVMKD